MNKPPQIVQPPVSHFLHVHPVGLVTNDKTAWICDSCGSESRKKNGMQRYKCTEKCDFDLCGDCVSQELHHLHQHPMSKSKSTKVEQWVCDGCKRMTKSVGNRYLCSKCQFDLCTWCWEKKLKAEKEE